MKPDLKRLNPKLLKLIISFALYALYGCTIWLFCAILLNFPIACTVLFALLLTVSIAFACPLKTWVKALPLQFVIGIGILLLPPYIGVMPGGSMILSSLIFGDPFLDVLWKDWLLYCVEITAIQLLGIGIRAVCRKIKKRYSGIPF